MSVEALLGTDRAFAADLQALRPQPGQTRRAPPTCAGCSPARAIVASHRTDDPRVQDAYSLRCTPQVHGAARDTVAHAALGRRASSSTSAIDNPMVLPDGRVESCGNFHGAPLGFACDFLAIAVAEVGAIAERRTDRMLDRTRSHGLPPFLAADAGRQLGADDRPLHAGGDGRREPPPGVAGQRRLAADVGDAGGPRLDGLGGGAQAAPRRSPTSAGSSPCELVVRGAWHRAAGAARTRRRPPQPPSPRCASRGRGRRPRPLAGARARPPPRSW